MSRPNNRRAQSARNRAQRLALNSRGLGNTGQALQVALAPNNPEYNTRTYHDAIPLPVSRQTRITVVRTAGFGTVIGRTAFSNFGVVQPTLAPFDSNGEFTAMFQQYKILQVTVHFIPVIPYFTHEITSATQANAGLLHSVIDYVETQPMTSITDAYEYASHKETMLKPMSRTFTPAIAVRGYGGITDAFVTQKFPWCDTTYNDMVSYGIRWGQEQMTGIPDSTVLYDIRVEAVISLRSTK